MKKLRGLLLVMTLLLFYGCATEKVPENSEDFSSLEPTIAVEEDIVKPEALIMEGVAEPSPVAVENFQIFNPQLTYPGAYNGPLYGTSEQVGSAAMDSYFELLDRNGINFFIGMFGISGEPAADTLISNAGLGKVIDAAQKHPGRIIPFFNPGIGGDEVEKYLGGTLTSWYTQTLESAQKIAGKDFIRGLGEVETQEWGVRHNDPRILQLINLAQANNIQFMFHPVASKIDDVEKIIEASPGTIFVIHMYREDLDKSMAKLISILQEHDNLYFSMDAAHMLFVNSLGGDIIYVYDSKNKQSSINRFISTFDSREKSLISDAIRTYKPLVDAVPDKIMWGTEIGPEYAFDPKVFDRAIKLSRFVIAGFEKEHQEAVGYKNALRVFGKGVVVDADIKVLDTHAWLECSTAQMDDCDTSCGNPDADDLTAEQEDCYQKCLIGKKCREVFEMDIG